MIWPLLVIPYAMMLAFIFCYSLVQLHLLVKYRRRKPVYSLQPLKNWPKVTVQLPIYNEQHVCIRLLNAVCAFNYPRELLQVQVLDDSTDATRQLVLEEASRWQELGVNVEVVHRPNRQGYKAGALAYGLQHATGQFIAIFDADFVPPPDFLRNTLPHFTQPAVGAVQTRWGHLNRDYSTLTRLQAFGLDAHFTLEQSARSASGALINFNGTAGIWRKQAIEQAGGWSADTLTEDLDLSYRAQLCGYKIVYREDLVSPAELPAEMNALRSQQYRWTKGAAECARKLLPRVWRSSQPWAVKVHATFHLLNSTLFLCILGAALLSVPIIWIKSDVPRLQPLFLLGGFLLLSLAILGAFYYEAWNRAKQLNAYQSGRGTFWWMFPLFLAMSMGLALHNSLAVVQGFAGKKTPFVRTPKFALVSRVDAWHKSLYATHKPSGAAWIEALLALYFLGGLGLGAYLGDYALYPFHAMLCIGFGAVSFLSVRHARQVNGA